MPAFGSAFGMMTGFERAGPNGSNANNTPRQAKATPVVERTIRIRSRHIARMRRRSVSAFLRSRGDISKLPNAQAEWRAARHKAQALYASRVHSSALLGMRQEAGPKPKVRRLRKLDTALDQPPNEVVVAEAATRTTLRSLQRTATRFRSAKSVRPTMLCCNLSRCGSKSPISCNAAFCYSETPLPNVRVNRRHAELESARPAQDVRGDGRARALTSRPSG